MFPSATEFRRPGPRAAIAGLALLGILWIAACGGGGGSSGAPVDPPPPPPPATTSGHLWYIDLSPKGSYIAPMDASTPPRLLTTDTDPTPWPDGSQYIEYLLGADGKTDTLRVLSTSDNRVLYQTTLPTFSGSELRPSPLSKTTVLSKYYATGADETGLMFVADVASGQLLYSEPVQYRTKKFRWLPNGRILRVDTLNGEVATGDTNGNWQVSGRVAIPVGQQVRAIEIDPQGTQMALVLGDISDTSSSSDAWVARLDGSQLERVTADHATNLVFWSPDGQRLLFDYDTSSCMGNGNCQGKCLLWHAPATARDLTGLYDETREPASAVLVRERFASGSVGPLITCTAVHGWLP